MAPSIVAGFFLAWTVPTIKKGHSATPIGTSCRGFPKNVDIERRADRYKASKEKSDTAMNKNARKPIRIAIIAIAVTLLGITTWMLSSHRPTEAPAPTPSFTETPTPTPTPLSIKEQWFRQTLPALQARPASKVVCLKETYRVTRFVENGKKLTGYGWNVNTDSYPTFSDDPSIITKMSTLDAEHESGEETTVCMLVVGTYNSKSKLAQLPVTHQGKDATQADVLRMVAGNFTTSNVDTKTSAHNIIISNGFLDLAFSDPNAPAASNESFRDEDYNTLSLMAAGALL